MPIANVLQPLIDIFESVMVFFHDHVGLSWGLSIIALTVVVRALLVPLTVKQLKSMQAMQRLAPEMKALQAKYKDDKPRQQQELMALYKEHGVNPFGSCLPLVAQLPVFLSLFYMLRHDLRIDICGQSAQPCGAVGKPEPFLFVPDITDKATGAVLATLLVLYVGSQLLSSIFMSASVDKNQRLLMMALPFVFTPFIIGFPAGLIVYWITTNFWTVGQGVIVRRQMGTASTPKKPPTPPDAGVEDAAPPRRRLGKAKAATAVEDPPPPPAPAPEQRRSGPPPSARKRKRRSGRRR
jgi:YidC/Oxa1 family membrane protein insertase